MSIAVRAVYSIPLFGWLVRDAVEGAPDAKYWFAGNVVVLLALSIWAFGYPVLLGLGLAGTLGIFCALIYLTSVDLLEGAAQKLRG